MALAIASFEEAICVLATGCRLLSQYHSGERASRSDFLAPEMHLFKGLAGSCLQCLQYLQEPAEVGQRIGRYYLCSGRKAFWNLRCSITDCYLVLLDWILTGTSTGRLDCIRLGFHRPCLGTALVVAAFDWITGFQLPISLAKRYGAET
jgi:hypothetical protein